MTIHRAHQIELIVNEKQELYMKKAVGCARFAFNWALNEWKQEYEAYKKDPSLPKPSQYSIRRKLNAVKREQFPWMMEVTDGSNEVRRADGDYPIRSSFFEFLEKSRTLQISEV